MSGASDKKARTGRPFFIMFLVCVFLVPLVAWESWVLFVDYSLWSFNRQFITVDGMPLSGVRSHLTGYGSPHSWLASLFYPVRCSTISDAKGVILASCLAAEASLRVEKDGYKSKDFKFEPLTGIKKSMECNKRIVLLKERTQNDDLSCKWIWTGNGTLPLHLTNHALCVLSLPVHANYVSKESSVELNLLFQSNKLLITFPDGIQGCAIPWEPGITWNSWEDNYMFPPLAEWFGKLEVVCDNNAVNRYMTREIVACFVRGSNWCTRIVVNPNSVLSDEVDVRYYESVTASPKPLDSNPSSPSSVGQ